MVIRSVQDHMQHFPKWITVFPYENYIYLPHLITQAII
jgi:hypothetical protein